MLENVSSYRNYKKETIYVLEGRLRIYTGASETNLVSKIYNPGESITLKPGQIHRMEGVMIVFIWRLVLLKWMM